MPKETGKLVVGLSSFLGAGKDYIADILVEKYGFYKISVGDMTRDMLRRAGRRITREAEEKLTLDYMNKHGKNSMMELCYKKIISLHRRRFVIPSIRYPNDFRFYKKRFGNNFINIFIYASSKERYARMIRRKRDDTPSSYNAFVRQDTAQQTRYNLKETKRISDFRINNNVDNSPKLIEALNKILRNKI
jgi:dephospho-CoA kinase